jgi:hypothetical protein
MTLSSRKPRLLPATTLLLLLTPAVARAQDFRVLEERRPVDPQSNQVPLFLPDALVQPRVLLAGDSWAQYMWDDGSHNDLFDRFGQADKRAMSLSLSSDPGPGYLGSEYAVSGSEARHWVDTANYPWIRNMVAALEANPTIDLVVLSIGGNDILAGKSGGGWYKDMDLDQPGSEAALFDRLENDTFTIVNAALAVRPDIKVILSSYDYPNFNVGFWCFAYACPKRADLSRDPTNDLITDQELNQLMVEVETRRIAWANAHDRVEFDHAVGLMHYWYGDGVSAPLALPYPGQLPPFYLPFPGGNVNRPTLRANFRRPNGLDADPIHLNFAGYQFKIAGETETTFFPLFRGEMTETFASEGGVFDGWSDGSSSGTGRIRIGDNGAVPYSGIVSFDTSSLPDGAVVTGAALYLVRESATGTNPFTSGAMGQPVLDVVTGSFGGAAVEPSDATAPAGASNVGDAIGTAKGNGYALRFEIGAAGLEHLNGSGRTQFRIRFPAASSGTTADYVAFLDGEAPLPPPANLPSVASYMGAAGPFLDVAYEVQSSVTYDVVASAVLRPNSPNPFRASTTIRFSMPAVGAVRIDIHDLSGRLVRHLLDGDRPSGNHTVVWDGADGSGRRVPSGFYLARLVQGGASRSIRMMLLDD